VITKQVLGEAPRVKRSQEDGYVAIMTALLMVIFMGLAAFAVDVGNWYVVGQQEQRAVDAAALAGVTYLPGDKSTAFSTAQNFSTINGFKDSANATTVTPVIDGGPTRLRVSASRTVANIFGSLLGVPTTVVTRTAVADYAGPVPLGSPCNEFGSDPTTDGIMSANCTNADFVPGHFWANVGSLAATKVSGDAYQDGDCTGVPDNCSGSTAGPNTDYDGKGYFYTVTVASPGVKDLKLEAFDPAMIVVGDHCDSSTANLAGAATIKSKDTVLFKDPSTRYVPNDGAWCTGDQNLGAGTGLVNTRFTVRDPGTTPWDPSLWPLDTGANCQQTFKGFNGDLSQVLDTSTNAYKTGGRQDVAANFRQWVTLCTIPGTVAPGTYAIQVNTNGWGADGEGGHNRFALRASGSVAGNNSLISVAGFQKMAMYANTPNGTTTDYLARIPSGAKGEMFNVRLYDIGDGAKNGSTIKILPPAEVGGTFASCNGTGPTLGSGALTDCTIAVDSSYNGKWETISVPVPASYTCSDSSASGCWVRLQFYYGAGSTPADTFSVTASINGDPVRLVQ
jgi:Putative Flp pilus-assembly TadE/G-like